MGQQPTPDHDPISAIAVRLLQAQASDTDELIELRDALRAVLELRDEGSAPVPAVRKLVDAARAKLDALLEGEPSDVEQCLAAAVRLVCLASSPGAEAPALAAERAPMARATVSPQGRASLLSKQPTLLPAEPDLELLGEFLTEANEHVVNAEAALLTLEARPDDAAAVNTVFRAFHTVKGVSAMLGLTALAQLAHHAESLLARIREGQISCTGAHANLCLRAIDMLKETLNAVAALLKGQPSELPAGYDALVRALSEPSSVSPEPRRSAPPVARSSPPLAAPPVPRADVACEVVPAPAAVATKPEPQGEPEPESALGKAGATEPGEAPARAGTGPDAGGGESSVRVRTDRLDRLIDMVGELVIAHSMLAQDSENGSPRDPDLHRKFAHAGKIVRELQDMSMSLRMVPLRPTFQKLARIVRDVARKSGKSIQLLTTGDDTEIDRNMVDVIAEPLIHMVRNAADHGIEAAGIRTGAGKPGTGTIRLAAYHSGGNVVIDLSDDGGGLDHERILTKATQKGLIEPSKGLSEAEIYQLIFLPGFSTAESVTDISGRGVGMDVVRRNIEKLKGRIDISSERGQGTMFSIRLPLTLAITDGMIVRVGAERYIIPTVNIALNFRPEQSQLSTVSGRGEVILLRGELIPLFRLYHLFRTHGAVEDPTRGLVVVLRDGASSCGLLVDELLGQQQVVAKSLGAGVGQVMAVSGGAILGDGRVGLILDPGSLIALARDSRGRANRHPELQTTLRTEPEPMVNA